MVTNLNVYFSLSQSGIVRDLKCGENIHIHRELNIYDFAKKAIKKEKYKYDLEENGAYSYIFKLTE